MAQTGSKLSLHHKITLGMIVGVIAGIGLNALHDSNKQAFEEITWWTTLFGKDLFIGTLKMLIAPLIFASIVAGVTSLPDSSALGSVGFKTFGFYFMSTTIAVSIGLAAVLLIKPGEKEASQELRVKREAELESYRQQWMSHHPGRDPLSDEHRADYLQFVASQSGEKASANNEKSWGRMGEAKEKSPGDMFKDKILKPILSNPFTALANGNTLGIIAFAVLMGLACVVMGESAMPVISFFQSLNEVIMKITLWVMEIAPYSIACLMATVIAELGLEGLIPLLWYGGTVVAGIAVHIIVLLLLVKMFGKMNPLDFIKGIRNAWMVAFTTTSSSATLPVTMKCVTENLKVSKKVAGFTLPVGATVNMDGTALYEGVAIIFMLQIFGGLDDVAVTLNAGNVLVIFITAVLASVGAASVPSAGLVTMAIVATAVGLPIHYIVYLFVIDHVLDMFRTSTNITGDAAASVVVERWNKEA